jgi:dipeptide/tripeptide permease
VLIFYRPARPAEAAARRLAESLRGLARVLAHGRFLSLILITAGFWVIQGQMYASMPKYVLRTVGGGATPEWYANVNPVVVVLLVVPVTQLVSRLQPVASIGIALAIIPLSALTMALSPALPAPLHLAGLAVHPVTLMMILGIALQGLAECFLSPRYLEYASKQAPPGQEGLYMGYAHLNTFFAWSAGWVISGYLLEAFCPDPARLDLVTRAQHAAALAGSAAMPAAYAHAHYIWYVFAVIGGVAFACLLGFARITRPRS